MNLPLRYPPASRGLLLVWGQLAGSPFGGMVWQVWHHLAALRRLGFDVWYVEDSDRLMWDPETYDLVFDYAPNLRRLAAFMRQIGFQDRWVFRPPEVYDRCEGCLDIRGLERLYADADAALNLCGSQEARASHERLRCRIYLETDPVANQIAVARGDAKRIAELERYDHLFTYGENLGASDCRVPVERFEWRPTRPPVISDWWIGPDVPPSPLGLSTVANWKHKGNDVEWRGETWRWSKHWEFERFLDLPKRSLLPLRIAVGAIEQDERKRLLRHGWQVGVSKDLEPPDAYRSYIFESAGEFTVAKEQYVTPRTGWFSDRSVCYLAAGRPVILQDTGFGKFIPTGEGLFAFSDEADILAAAEAIRCDYARHSRTAREIAHEYFEAERLLAGVLRTAGLF